MNATVLDFRRKMKDILRALDREEEVTLTYRGKPRAVLVPLTKGKAVGRDPRDHPFFGMWKNREELQDVSKFVRKMRRWRPHVV